MNKLWGIINNHVRLRAGSEEGENEGGHSEAESGGFCLAQFPWRRVAAAAVVAMAALM